jgi:hypothetical protein
MPRERSEPRTGRSLARVRAQATAHAIAQVRNARSVDHARELQLDVLGAEPVEQQAAVAQQHRDLVDLQLVEHARPERELRRPGAMDQHVPVARGRLGACHRIRHIVDDDRAGRHQLGVDLAVDARRPDPAAAVGQPLVQALPAVPEPVADVVRRTGDEPVDIDM